MKRVVVTGGAGFIGSSVVRHLVQDSGYEVLNLDALTYAGNLASLRDVAASPRYRFVQAAFAAGKPIAAVNLGRTRADELFTLKIAQPVGQTLAALVAALNEPIASARTHSN